MSEDTKEELHKCEKCDHKYYLSQRYGCPKCDYRKGAWPSDREIKTRKLLVQEKIANQLEILVKILTKEEDIEEEDIDE